MKRIEAFIKGKIEDSKASNRLKRIEAGLSAAKINLEEQVIDCECKMEELTMSLATTKDVNSTIQSISECMDKKCIAEEGLKRIQTMEQYFKEDIKVG